MKKIYGIVTGMGAFAGSHLYEAINFETARLNGFEDVDDSAFPEIWIHQIPFKDSDYKGDSDYQQFREAVENSLSKMESLNVTDVAFACNTYDSDFKDLARSHPFNYISITNLVKREVARIKPNRLSVLASQQSIGVNVHDYEFSVDLEKANQAKVDGLILSSMSGRSNRNQHVFNNLLDELEANGADYHLLGCTELSLYNFYPERMNVIDSTKLLAKYIAKDNRENKK